ncbi:MAG: FimV/HubP family polar landmark protein, partial [Gammaproteobacteria bacterium]
TSEMDSIAADDTIDMAASVDAGGDEDAIDLSDSSSLDELTQQLDGALDDPALDDLEIEGGEDEHVETLKLEGNEELSIDIEPEVEKTVAIPVDGTVEMQSDSDEADTKLNLAKAYIELGDTDGARSILNEVSTEGNEAQQAEAQELLAQL